ncbi:helix-turn-helix transcriptional regulator [Bacteroides fragilis]|nr:helix-turn-helix transcriptional regulator [Bacteroides fragilis]KAA4760238.1 helix-turn-helix transcriptional regulator [Bacteroides fragilis]KAA4764415.1 helix-turn-helix transcriptional regulator [Bacteroides fragilis]KAA4766556.1 helix-turn-helix transcriptional regulator [Bacteroides fragilis]KAA4777664.1 helix-turn-helix transcriptional regulator [Bacteroides fragilis]
MKNQQLLDIEETETGPLPENNKEEIQVLLHIGNTIKEARVSKKLTQDQLAKLVSIPKSQISQIENGKDIPLFILVKIFKALGVSVALNIDGYDKINL